MTHAHGGLVIHALPVRLRHVAGRLAPTGARAASVARRGAWHRDRRAASVAGPHIAIFGAHSRSVIEHPHSFAHRVDVAPARMHGSRQPSCFPSGHVSE